MASQLGNERMDGGGICYVACQEAFDWWNASMHWCRKGCDFAKGRVSDPILRYEANNMCKMMAVSMYRLEKWEDLDNIKDLRIHSR